MLLPFFFWLAAFQLNQSQAVQQPPIAVYKQFEDFKPLLERSSDTTYVINFWATWCSPCVKELPHFDSIAKISYPFPVKVLLVSLDDADKNMMKVREVLKRKKVEAEVVIFDNPNANSWIDSISTAWSGAIPATLIYNRHKRNFYEKAFTFDELHLTIETFNLK